LDRFAVDPFTVLRGNYIAGNDARKRQEEGNLKLGEIVLVYSRPPSIIFPRNQPVPDPLDGPELTRYSRLRGASSDGIELPRFHRKFLSARGATRFALFPVPPL
jgi:hypothetical protein